MMDHQGDGWGTDFSYGLHFGGIWSFLVYAGVLIGTIVLMCMKIEQPAAATEEVAAVAATPAPIAAQAVAMAVPAEAKARECTPSAVISVEMCAHALIPSLNAGSVRAA